MSISSAHKIRSTRHLVGGLLIIAIAIPAFILSGKLTQGTPYEMGPGLFPRWLSIVLGLCGLALVAASFRGPVERFNFAGWRGPVLVTLAIVGFALTLRPFPLFGGLSTPGGGLLIAGPIALILSSFATPDARLRELVILALGMTAFCMVLFGDLLNLPLPMYPRWLAETFLQGWPHKQVLRLLAILMLVAAGVLVIAGKTKANADQ